MWYIPLIVFFAVQLPATLLLGAVAGVLAVHIVVARRGRVSLRVVAALVLIAALESAAIVQNPAAWVFLLPIFLLAGGAMALVDLAIILGLDRRRPPPRFSPRARRRGLVSIPFGLVALSLVAGAIFKYGIAFNPAEVSWLGSAAGFLGLLVVPALIDLTVRLICTKVVRNRSTA